MYWIALTYLLLAPEPFWFLSGTEGTNDSYALSVPDLIQHFLVFGLLGLLLASQLEANKLLSRTLRFAVIYAIATEFVQFFVPDRFASVADVLANLSGLVIGWGTVQFLRSMTSLRRVRTSNAISS